MRILSLLRLIVIVLNVEEINMSGTHQIKRTPEQWGEQFAKSGLTYCPYEKGTRNAIEFQRGVDNYLRRTAGVPKGKEQPLP